MLHADTVNTLDLSNNEINILRNNSLSSLSRLLKLILSRNETEEIEINAFAGLGMMKDIDLSYNNLQSFNPEIFSFNPVLEEVSLKGNPIAYLSSSSPILISSSVSSLDLSSCSVSTIHPVTFSRLPKLYFLDLRKNLLQTISVSTLQKLPNLTILELNNNRWTCNCDKVEVIEWAESIRGQLPPQKPVRCLEGQHYKILWTKAGSNRSYSESKTTEPVVEREREFTTDMAVELSITSIAPQIKALPGTTLQRVIENAVTSEAVARDSEFTTEKSLKASPDTISQRAIENEVKNDGNLMTVPESETEGWARLLPWIFFLLIFSLIVLMTHVSVVLVYFKRVNYIVKSLKDHRNQHDNTGTDNHVATVTPEMPLLNKQLNEEDLQSQENKGIDGVGGTIT